MFPDADYGTLAPKQIAQTVAVWLSLVDPDVVVVNGWGVAEARAALRWARARPKVRVVVMSETSARETRRYFWKEALKRWLLRGAHAGLVGGALQADYLLSLGVDSSRIFLGYNAIDNDYFSNSAARCRTSKAVEARQAERHPSQYFFACGRFVPRKNYDLLLEAYARYRGLSGSDSWNLVISGSGEDESRLRKIAVEVGVSEYVTWPGFLQYAELPEWYAHASAFIHPAKMEAWGLVVNEAAACGLPLLLSENVGAASELLVEGANGYAFDPGSIDQMAAAMVRVSRLSKQQREEFGLRSRERVDEFGPVRFAQGLLEAIRAAQSVRA